MAQMKEQDMMLRGWKTVAWVLVALVGVSLIPPMTVGGIELRRANIFSDLYSFHDATQTDTSEEIQLFDEAEFEVDMEAVSEQVEAMDSIPRQATVSYEWPLTMADMEPQRDTVILDSRRFSSRLTPIEDFSTDNRFATFCDTLIRAD
ncbi:MAG: hypothetical protein IIX78_06250, partial [Alistipes sp.]|nr:hypothetical protein [Alistipes sp.]